MTQKPIRPEQYIGWLKFIADDASSTTANAVADELTIAGGAGISTAIVGDTLIITSSADLSATLDDIYNNSPSAAKTIIVDDGPLTLDTADETALFIDTDTNAAGTITLDDRIIWDEDITVSSTPVDLTHIGIDCDITTDLFDVVSITTDYTWLDLDITSINPGVNTNQTWTIFDVDVDLADGVVGHIEVGLFANWKYKGNSVFTVGDGSDPGGGIGISSNIFHIGDMNTNMTFIDDHISMEAGGVSMLDLVEAAQDSVIINETGVNIDFRAESENRAHMFFLDASVDTIGIDESAPDTNVSLHIGSDGYASTGKGIRNDHPPRCRAYLSGHHSLATSTTWAVALNAETHDSDSIHSTTVNNNRITPGVAGYYLVIANIAYNTTIDNKRYMCAIRVNGADVAISEVAGSTNKNVVANVSDITYLSSTDYVDMTAWHDSGVNKNVVGTSVRTFLTVHRIS